MTGAEVADELTEANEKPAITERETKEALLKHYATREPKSFVQFDGWYGGKWRGDSVIATDEAGRSMTSGLTTELMNGADMRLLIEPGADAVEIVALLHQAAEWIMRAPDILDSSSRWHGSKPHLVEPREEDDRCARCGASMQATHHPSCETRDGTPTGLADETVQLMTGTPSPA